MNVRGAQSGVARIDREPNFPLLWCIAGIASSADIGNR
jgi:hypothetical protein